MSSSEESPDIIQLKVQSRQFVYDLAKTDLCFYYKKSIDGVEEVNRKAWELYRDSGSGSSDNDKRIKLLALRLAKECNEAVFSLFSQGPSIMNIKALAERLNKVENSSSRQIIQKPIWQTG